LTIKVNFDIILLCPPNIRIFNRESIKPRRRVSLEEGMKLKSFLVLLVAVAFIFSVSCKQKAKETAPAKAEVKAQAQVVEKTEAKEEKGEKAEAGEKTEAKPAVVDLKVLPDAVLAAFKAAYPKAEIKGASKEVENGVTQFEVESVDGKLNRDLIYAADGKVLEFEEAVAPESLPAAVKATLAKDYADAKVLKAETLTKDGTMVYELSLQGKDKKMGVTIDPNGKVIAKPPAEKKPVVKK
jgi:outer membrane lipoprotein-sorting protein